MNIYTKLLHFLKTNRYTKRNELCIILTEFIGLRGDSLMDNNQINIVNATENNLKNVSIQIPKNKLVVVAGVSGSGKSSLIFDTLATEASREWQNSYSLYIRNKLPHYQRPNVELIENLTPSIIVKQQQIGQNGRSSVGTIVDVAPLLRLLFSRVGIPSAGGSMSYSKNHPAGMCPICTGLGTVQVLDEDSLFDMEKTLNEGAIQFSAFRAGWQNNIYTTNGLLNPDKRLKDFTNEELQILRDGTETSLQIEIRSNKTGRVDHVDYEGVIPRFKRLYLKRDISKLKGKLRDEIYEHITTEKCEVCGGTGLNEKALASKINNFNIVDMMRLPVENLLPEIGQITDAEVGH